VLKYSIVIPVFNERDNLPILESSIEKAMGIISDSFEVVLVDDGSTDESDKVIKGICKENRKFRGVFFDKNYGQTAAFDAGFKSAKGDMIITMDADLQYDPKDISLLLEKLGEYDVVCGYREKRNDSWLKRISSIIANTVRNKLSDEQIRDVGCSLRAFKREKLGNLRLFEGLHRFLPTLLKLEGCSVIEVPVHHYPRIHGVSKYNIRNRVFRSFRDLLAVRWMMRRYLNYKIISEE
jgi:glycosyltransferase involved in cell wall biosynthesis